ncbi:MAG: PqiC family protein [Halieaceae bacterium]
MNARRFTLLFVFASMLAACGSSPSVKYYTLSPEAAAGGSNPNLALKIGPVEFPRSLARSQIVTRASSTQLNVDEFNIWSAPLENQFLQVLGDNIGTATGSNKIVVYPNEATFPVDYQVLVDVLQFDGDKGSSVTLRARWAITKADGSAVDSGLYAQSQASGGSSYDALVAAHSALVAALGQQLVTHINKLQPSP